MNLTYVLKWPFLVLLGYLIDISGKFMRLDKKRNVFWIEGCTVDYTDVSLFHIFLEESISRFISYVGIIRFRVLI